VRVRRVPVGKGGREDADAKFLQGAGKIEEVPRKRWKGGVKHWVFIGGGLQRGGDLAWGGGPLEGGLGGRNARSSNEGKVGRGMGQQWGLRPPGKDILSRPPGGIRLVGVMAGKWESVRRFSGPHLRVGLSTRKKKKFVRAEALTSEEKEGKWT